MKKIIHVHVHEPTSLDDARVMPYSLAATRDSDDGDGHWVTIHGAHVHIGKGGKIDKGPPELTGKSEHEAHADGHAQKSRQHEEAAAGKGPRHPDTKYHHAAAREHSNAAIGFRNAHMAAEMGDLTQARKDHHNASVSATGAAWHEEQLKAPAKPEGASKTPADKPKAHVALHSEAEDDVKGSEKHEAEHKRLMKLYDSSKASWEHNAVNRQIQNNATAAVQHKAQGLHHQALAAHEHAKQTGSLEDRRKALAHIDAADVAHGKAGGVGYLAKQKELHAMRKEHQPHVEKADKAAASLSVKSHNEHAADHRTTAQKMRAKGDEVGAKLHEQASDLHRVAAQKTTAMGAGAAAHSQAAQKATEALGGTGRTFGGGTNASSPDRKRGKPSGGGGGSAMDAMALRAAKRAAEEAADQDPKHKK